MSRNGGKPMGFSEWNPYAKLTAIVLSFILLAPVGAHAQSFLASVSGIVNDPTGAVVPSVKVVATDTARGVSFTTTSNQDGVYIINNLIPSSYRVTVEAAGFQTYVLNAFPLTAKQEAVLNITLQLGTATQTVEVSSQVQMVDPSNATLGGVVNNKSIVGPAHLQPKHSCIDGHRAGRAAFDAQQLFEQLFYQRHPILL